MGYFKAIPGIGDTLIGYFSLVFLDGNEHEVDLFLVFLVEGL
jgi:hypothetical protein